MQAYPEVFDHTFTSLVMAGEQSGKLTEVFKNLSESLKWQDELASQTKKIVMYPAAVGLFVTAVTFFLMIYLVPQLTSFVKNMGNTLPLHTRALIWVSNIFIGYWYIIVALPVVGFFGIRTWLGHSEQARYVADGFKLRVWLIGPVLHKIMLARFATFFALEVGLVNRVVPPSECNALAQRQARKLAAKPLTALVESKRLMKAGQAALVRTRMAEEGQSFGRMLHEPAAREAVSAFMEKRHPDFSRV